MDCGVSARKSDCSLTINKEVNMSNEMFTQLPSVTSALPSDIICAVQGGVSVQETLQQISNLLTANIILNYPGNPNGNLAGVTFQLCFDTTDAILYVCTSSGSASTAVWKKSITLTAGTGLTIVQNGSNITLSVSGSGTSWVNVTGTSQAMISNTSYVPNNAGLVTLSLPTTSSFGDVIDVVGYGAGGWTISQATGQQIILGVSSTTSGSGGSVSSTNKNDSLSLVCVVANTIWTLFDGPQGNLTIV